MEHTKSHYTVHVLSNTHWDREWYMSHEKYLVRLIRLMDRLMEIMEAQPEYIFITDGQFSMVDDYLQNRPEKKEQLMQFVREGRLKVGPWFTQPLETLVSGEAMVRNLHYGIKESEALGGAMRFSYEVDEFGHASQTPQILKGFGIDGAIAWRGVPRDCRSAFEWVSPDGTSVVMLNTNCGYGEATALPMQNEDFTEVIDGVELHRAGLYNRVNSALNLRIPRADTEHLMWLNGIDHSFAQPDVPEVIEKIRAEFPELTIYQSTCEDYLDGVLSDLSEKGIDMARVEGELMYSSESILESTHACHPRQKLKHYETERYLERHLEPMTTLAWLSGFDDRKWAQDRAWKYVLENHAHDTLGCTSVDEVYEEAMARYGCALSLAQQVTEDCRRDVMSRMKDGLALTVFNTSAFPAKGVYHFSLNLPAGYGRDNFALEDEAGNRIPVVVTAKKDDVDVRFNPRMGHPTATPSVNLEAMADIPEIAPFGWMRFTLIKNGEKRYMPNRRSYFHAPAPGVMENAYLRCQINANGTVGIFDKVTGKVYQNQFLFEDTGDVENVYKHIPPFEDKTVYSLGANADVALIYDTPLGCLYEVRLNLRVPDGAEDQHRRSAYTVELPITLKLFLGKDARHLDADITVDNRAKEHRLRVLFPTNFTEATVSRGGQPFDVVARPIYEETNLDGLDEQPWPTHPMQDICDVAGTDAGLTVAAGGIYEYECIDTPTRTLALTLLRASGIIYRDWTSLLATAAETLGEISYHISLYPHDGDFKAVYGNAITALTKPVFALNRQPEDSVLTDYVPASRDLPDTGSAVTLNGTHLAVTTIKRAYADDSLIVRIHNYGDTPSDGVLSVSFPGMEIKRAFETDLDECVKAEMPVTDGSVRFTLRKAGILTLKLEV